MDVYSQISAWSGFNYYLSHVSKLVQKLIMGQVTKFDHFLHKFSHMTMACSPLPEKKSESVTTLTVHISTLQHYRQGYVQNQKHTQTHTHTHTHTADTWNPDAQ